MPGFSICTLRKELEAVKCVLARSELCSIAVTLAGAVEWSASEVDAHARNRAFRAKPSFCVKVCKVRRSVHFGISIFSECGYGSNMHKRSWKEFEGVAARKIPDEIRSSINPGGEITFDLDTFRKMGEPQAMKLLYEPSTRTIGLRPSHPDAHNAVLVRVRHARSNRVVRSMPFLRENGIDVPRTLRFPFPALEDNVLILDLRTAVTCGKGGWKKVKKRW